MKYIPQHLRKYAVLLIVPLACIIVYSGTLNYPFHFDDYPDIVENSAIRSLTNPDIWATSRPLAYLTFAINYAIHGLDVRGFHIFNIAMHIATSLLVWWLITLLFQTPQLGHHRSGASGRQIALFTALLFAVHPIQIQAVTYIVQRMAMLSTFWYLLALCCYIQARLKEKNHILLYIAAISAGLCSIMTKQIAATLPFTILLVEFAFFNKAATLRKLLIGFVAVYTVVVSAYLIKAGILWRTIQPQQGNPNSITPVEYMVTQLRVVVTYLRLIIFPIKQNLDYDYPINSSMLHIPTLLSMVLLASLLFLAVKLWKSQKLIAVGIFWFFLTLSVESSIITLPNVIFEHRLYLPAFGAFLALITTIHSIANRHNIRILVSCIIILMGFLTIQRNKVWRTELSLWSDVVKKSPGKPRAWNNRGEWNRKAGNWDQALADYSSAIELYPAYPEARNNRGALYLSRGNYAQAIVDFNIAIEDGTTRKAELHYNRGTCFMMIGDYESATADFLSALQRRPTYIKALMNLGNTCVKQKQYNQARSYYQRVLEINPEFDEVYYNIGIACFEERNWQQAIVHLRKAIAMNSKRANAYLLLGQSYYQVHNFESARTALTAAIDLNPIAGTAWAYLGYVYLSLGKKQLAKTRLKKAQQLGVKIHPDALKRIGTL